MSIITLILGVVVFGSASLTGMPLEYMPDMEMPMELVMITGQMRTAWTGC